MSLFSSSSVDVELMSLLHPGLLLGLGLSIIPILLHLLLRAKPKRLIFPALRLIQQNRRQNVRRMRLRHFWLLLFRVLVIGLIALAFTRPTLPAANYALTRLEWVKIVLLASCGLGGYFGMLGWWKRSLLTRQQLLTRQSWLRGVIIGLAGLLLLLGVAWPYGHRVSAEIKDPAPHVAENLPVAAMFLFDTSPSMSYRQGNQSRLQSAQQIARDHLSRLPAGSKVAVATLHEASWSGAEEKEQVLSERFSAFSLDLQAARGRIDACEIKAGGLKLNDRLRSALLAHEADRRRLTAEQTSLPEEKRQDRYVREIYLFTDLTRTAWREEGSRLLLDELARLKTLSVYLIDVGESNPMNVGITSLKPLRETVPAGSSVRVDLGLSATGPVKPEQTVEFFLLQDGKLVKRGQHTITVAPGIERRLTFEIPAVATPILQGEFRLIGSDPMTVDDVEYFTIRTLPPLKVLIVAETEDVAFYWKSAMEYVSSAKITEFQVQFLRPSQLPEANLKSFDVIYLINVSSPAEALWARLHDYVDGGGGLGLFLGAASSALNQNPRRDQINPVAYCTPAALSVLPAELVAALPPASGLSIDLRNSQHGLLKRLEEAGALSELGASEISRFWKVAPQESAILVARYEGILELPALVERRIGRGRVMMMTTSVDDPKWNDIVGSALSFVFSDQLTQYLSQQTSLPCNFQVGNEVLVPLDRDQNLRKVVLRMPDFKQHFQEIPDDAKAFRLRDLTTLGSYQVDSTEGNLGFHSGFSINLPAGESDLRRLETQDLDDLLGEGRYSMSRDPGSLERNVQTRRLGREIYGFLVGLLICVFALEQLTATWFYRTENA